MTREVVSMDTVVTLVLLSLSCVTATKSHKFGPAITEFSTNVFRELNREHGEENLAISPTNIFRALLLTYFGSGGNTTAALERVLELKMSYSEVAAEYDVWRNGTVEGVREADRIYFNSNLSLEERIVSFLGDELSQLDFTQNTSVGVINDWVENKTEGEIKHFIDRIDQNTEMLVITASHLQAMWQEEFNVNKTYDFSFFLSNGSVISVLMMNKLQYFQYHNSTVLMSEILTIPYTTEGLSFVILLPFNDGYTTVETVIHLLSYENMKELKRGSQKELNLYLPKFKVEQKVEMKKLLLALGLSEIFSPGIANFTGFTSESEIYVSDVFQKVSMEIDEKGTKAAAASVVVFTFLSFAPIPSFRVNRPFIYMVYDDVAEVPLFLGTMMQPEIYSEE